MLLLTLNMNMFNFVIDNSFNDYINLWQEGINQGKAYYIDFSGRKIKAVVKNILRLERLLEIDILIMCWQRKNL